MAVSDLTNTTWVNKDTWSATASLGVFNITGTITYNNSEETFSDMKIGYWYLQDDDEVVSQANCVVWTLTTQAYKARARYPNEKTFTITITGGTDATNATLITWLEANATQQVVSTGKTQLGTRTITKKMFGTREITKEVVNGVVVYEKQAPVSNVTITFNLSFAGLGIQNALRFNFDTPFDGTNHWDWDVAGGWAYTGFRQNYYNYTGNAPTMPSGQVFASTSTFTIEVPIGTEIYVYKGGTGGTATLNGSTPSTNYAQATKITITQDITFNISVSGEDD